MHYILQAVIISLVIGVVGRKLYRHITIPPFVKKCARDCLRIRSSRPGICTRRARTQPTPFHAFTSLSRLTHSSCRRVAGKGSSASALKKVCVLSAAISDGLI
jgi:hypothetical protein